MSRIDGPRGQASTTANPTSTVADGHFAVVVPKPPWRALPVILLGSFLASGSFFVVNVALPTIGHELHAGSAQLSLVVAAYSASYAALLVAGGRLGDRYGRRRLFVVGAAAFAATALVCTVAVNGWMLVASRLVQGAAAAMLTPQVLGTIQAAFSGRDRQRALGFFGAVLGASAVAGQMFGGVAGEFDLFGLGWRTAFMAMVPVAVAIAVLGHLVVPESTGDPVPVDLSGAGLLTLALALLLLPLSLGSDLGWPVWCWLSMLLALVVAGWFVLAERRIERSGGSPLLPLSLFGMRSFRAGLLVALLFFMALGGFFLVTGIAMQNGIGLTPIGTALLLVPYGLGFLTCSLLVSRLVARYGGRVIVAGAGVLALASIAFAAQIATEFAHLSGPELIPALAVMGFGQGMVMVPVFGQVLAQLPARWAGVAAGALTTAQQGGIAVGAASLGAVLFSIGHGPAHAAAWGHAIVVVFLVKAGLATLTAVYAHRGIVRPS